MIASHKRHAASSQSIKAPWLVFFFARSLSRDCLSFVSAFFSPSFIFIYYYLFATIWSFCATILYNRGQSSRLSMCALCVYVCLYRVCCFVSIFIRSISFYFYFRALNLCFFFTFDRIAKQLKCHFDYETNTLTWFMS